MLVKNLAAAAAVASTSHIMAERAKEYIHNDTPVFITPFGIDVERFKPLPYTASGEFVIGTVKRLEPECGIGILLKAFKIFRTMVRMNEPQKRLRLKIYGQGSEYTPLLGLARELLIGDETDFMGPIPNTEVPHALAQMDIVCLPSKRESFGVAALEAMACERAVVTSDADGFLETVKDGVTGVITHSLDENNLAQELFALYHNAPLRSALGFAGRRHVVEHYSMELCARQMEEALFYTARTR
jgi:glycosyltransferase involved in cell wall biosynthesis